VDLCLFLNQNCLQCRHVSRSQLCEHNAIHTNGMDGDWLHQNETDHLCLSLTAMTLDHIKNKCPMNNSSRYHSAWRSTWVNKGCDLYSARCLQPSNSQYLWPISTIFTQCLSQKCLPNLTKRYHWLWIR